MGSRLQDKLYSFLKHLGYVVASVATGFASSREGEVAVLMYHAVDHSNWRLSVLPENFERHMKYLRRHRVVVPLTDVVAHAKGEKRLAERSVAVTFDDGYADLVSTVLPIIKRFRIPITLFLTTDVSENTNSKNLSRITWDDVRILKESGLVTIESHGRTHPHLPTCTSEEVRTQLREAQADISRELGNPARYFAYPFGDCSPEVVKATHDAGYDAAFSISEGFVRKGSDLAHLPRIQVDATMTPFLFARRLTPALDMNRRMVRILRGI